MSIRYFPLKSVILEATLNNQDQNELVYKLCPINEFSDGTWHISVSTLSYLIKPIGSEIRDIFSLSCNFVKGQKLSNSNVVESYELPLSMFLCKNVQGKFTKSIINFDQKWFHINALSNELKFSLTNQDNVNYNYDLQIFLHVVFQRVF